MKKIIFLTLPTIFYCVAASYSIQIPLKQSDGATFAFVDMDRVFEEHPKLKQAKEQYDDKKKNGEAELQKVEAEITALTEQIKVTEKDLEQAKERLNNANRPVPPPVIPQEVAVSSGVVSVSSAPVSRTGTNTAVVVGSTTVNASTATPVSPGANTTVVVDSMTVNGSTVTPVAAPISPPVPREDTVAIQAQIIQKQTDLKMKTDDLAKKKQNYAEQKQKINKELQLFQENTTLSLMADVYSTIQYLAKEENISVVVDKSKTIYGTPKIDLTDKLLERLRGK